MNTSGAAQTVALAMNGKNATTEDEDTDGQPDAWELRYFASIGTSSSASDPDGDGVANSVELTDGTIPNNVNSAKYFLTLTPVGGTLANAPDLPKYDRGSVVNLTDTPLSNYAFFGWQRTGGYGDEDGTKNLIEFAFDLDPKSGASLQLPQPQRVGGNLVISFTEPAGINGIIYGAEWSSSLAPGCWMPIPDTGIGGVHTFSVPIAGKPRLFTRLLVTMP